MQLEKYLVLTRTKDLAHNYLYNIYYSWVHTIISILYIHICIYIHVLLCICVCVCIFKECVENNVI